jgi:O-antigen/teichoic acid export membrane protein
MIFADKPIIVRVLLRPPDVEVSTLLLSLLKEMGGVMLMLSLLLWFTARDPVRNVAILDALIAGLCILSVTPLLSLWMTDIRGIYPAYLIWGRSVVRLAVAALLYWQRPREGRWESAGRF